MKGLTNTDNLPLPRCAWETKNVIKNTKYSNTSNTCGKSSWIWNVLHWEQVQAFDWSALQADQAMHGSGTRIINSTDGVQLEIEDVNCHVFVISDSQFNILEHQLESMPYWTLLDEQIWTLTTSPGTCSSWDQPTQAKLCFSGAHLANHLL